MPDDGVWAGSDEAVRAEDGDFVQEEPLQRLEAPDAYEGGGECYEGGDVERRIEGKGFGCIGGVGAERCVRRHG